MYSSQNKTNNIVFALYNTDRTVFRFNQIALLSGEQNFQSLSNKINYAVRTGKLLNPRKGIYTKPEYSKEEMACLVYVPSYISLEYVLQKAGVIFQYDSSYTVISYISRMVEIDNQSYRFRKIKATALSCTDGILRHSKHINMASAERAFLDLLYLEKDYYFDNLNPLNKSTINKLLPVYQSEALKQRVKMLFNNG
ncbi:MAG: hypothetical protein HQ541_07925 [Mariniphaga sp.]|nr:hypothetical protein [Mariniphaga sp.]